MECPNHCLVASKGGLFLLPPELSVTFPVVGLSMMDMIAAPLAENKIISLSREELSVKMFILQEPSEAEKVVADWLSRNHVAIRHVTQSQSERNGRFLFIISIFYLPV